MLSFSSRYLALLSGTIVMLHLATHCRRNVHLRNTNAQFILLHHESPRPREKSLHLIGERHSGTRWIHNHLRECFNHSITVEPRLTRWKHWFQYEDDVDAFHEIHVVVLFRNPFDWVESMRKVPYHCPNHVNKNWSDFVTTAWTMERFGRDLDLEAINQTDRACDQGFYYDEVIPCLELEPVGKHKMYPKYELRHDRSGLPYSSVVDLRRDKILNFLSIEQYSGVKFFETWRYEDLVQQGSIGLLERLEEVMGTRANCRPRPPRELKMLGLEEDYIQWMNDHVDWDYSEALVGYSQWDDS